jgi:hypothetical protein
MAITKQETFEKTPQRAVLIVSLTLATGGEMQMDGSSVDEMGG